MNQKTRKWLALLLCFSVMMVFRITAYGVYLPDVTSEMSSPRY